MRESKLEIISKQVTLLGHCTFCDNVMLGFNIRPQEGQLEEYPVEFRRKILVMSELINSIANRFNNLKIVIYDAASITGLLKMLKHMCFRDPVFILNGKVIYRGGIPSYKELESVISRYIENKLLQ